MCLKVYSSTDLFFKAPCFCQVTLAFCCALSITAIRVRTDSNSWTHLMTVASNDSSDCAEYCVVENDGKCCVDAVLPTGERTGLVGSINSSLCSGRTPVKPVQVQQENRNCATDPSLTAPLLSSRNWNASVSKCSLRSWVRGGNLTDEHAPESNTGHQSPRNRHLKATRGHWQRAVRETDPWFSREADRRTVSKFGTTVVKLLDWNFKFHHVSRQELSRRTSEDKSLQEDIKYCSPQLNPWNIDMNMSSSSSTDTFDPWKKTSPKQTVSIQTWSAFSREKNILSLCQRDPPVMSPREKSSLSSEALSRLNGIQVGFDVPLLTSGFL